MTIAACTCDTSLFRVKGLGAQTCIIPIATLAVVGIKSNHNKANHTD